MHGWVITKHHDLVLDDHIRAHPEPEKQQSGRDKTFLPKVEQRGGHPVLGMITAMACMLGWAAVLWLSCWVLALIITGRSYWAVITG